MRPGSMLLMVGVTALAVLAQSCAAAPPPPPEVARAAQRVRLAEDFGASDEPEAALHLALAREQIQVALDASARGEPDAAARWALRAESDADLAVLVARDANVRRAALRTQQEASELGEELNRRVPPPAQPGAHRGAER